MIPAERPEEPEIEGPLGAPVPGGCVCVAPWYSMPAKGFVPRLYLLDEGGWVLRRVDGGRALPTYAEALEASRLLRLDTDAPTTA